MKNFGKLISVLLCIATVLSIMSFVSCSDGNSGDTETTDPVQEVPVYSVGISVFGHPYVFSQEDKVSGICVDILANIAEKNREELRLKVVETSELISGLVNGDYSAALAPADTYMDEETATNIVVSETFISDKYVMLVSAESRISRLYDLAILSSKKVGVMADSVAKNNAVLRYGEESVITYTTNEDGIAALKAGDIDAFVVNSENSKILNDTYIAENGIKLLSDVFYSVDYALFMKGENDDIRVKTDNALSILNLEKKIDAIRNEYILAENANK
ncbi:MAG: transporter substrate-binding domain-containing protein [Clostridia bacterium]|nr:transporter substrate-binding domain-containing protein [Clostridia bacterium]MBR5453751.1 transporter substrate-binding domain-containing protein [Clostridia bacterium]